MGNEIENFEFSMLSYLVVKPSMFPPSPMVMYTGADWSCLGMHRPFTMLYSMLDTRYCHNSRITFQIMLKNLESNESELKGKTYASLVGMDMTGKHHVDLVLNNPGLEHDSHGVRLHVMVVVAVVPRGMQHNYQPRRLGPVHLSELRLEPHVLGSVSTLKRGKGKGQERTKESLATSEGLLQHSTKIREISELGIVYWLQNTMIRL